MTKLIVSIILGVISIIVYALKRKDDYVRELDKQIDDLDNLIRKWEKCRDKALKNMHSDTLSVCHDTLIGLRKRRDTLLQRRREALYRQGG